MLGVAAAAGNFCSGGAEGREKGHGRVIVSEVRRGRCGVNDLVAALGHMGQNGLPQCRLCLKCGESQCDELFRHAGDGRCCAYMIRVVADVDTVRNAI
jgi:hypothetical protein